MSDLRECLATCFRFACGIPLAGVPWCIVGLCYGGTRLLGIVESALIFCARESLVSMRLISRVAAWIEGAPAHGKAEAETCEGCER